MMFLSFVPENMWMTQVIIFLQNTFFDLASIIVKGLPVSMQGLGKCCSMPCGNGSLPCEIGMSKQETHHSGITLPPVAGEDRHA